MTFLWKMKASEMSADRDITATANHEQDCGFQWTLLRVDRKGFVGKSSPFIITFEQLLFTLLFLLSLEGADSCSKTQFNLVYPDGSTSCVDCERCPPGQGLSHECGTSISSDAMVTCKACISGKSFSESFDTSSCSPCAPPCLKDQVVLQKCTPTKNIRCAKECHSKDSYFDSTYVECRTCSRCCGDDEDVVEDECKKKLGSASNRICSFHSSVNRCETTTMSVQHISMAVGKDPTYSSATPSNVTPDSPPHNRNDLPNSQTGSVAVAVGVSFGAIILVLAVGCAIYWLCRRKRWRFSCYNSSIEAGAHSPTSVPETTTLVHRKDEQTDKNLMKGDSVELAMEEVQQGSSDPLLEKVVPAQVTWHEHQKQEGTKKESKPLKSLLEHLKTLQKICEALDTPVPGRGDYQEVAQHYDFDYYQRKSVLEKAEGGPSKAMIEGLAASHIELTVEEFALVVGRESNRQDVVKLLRDYDEED